MEFDGDNAIEIAVLGRNALEDPQLHCMSTIVYSFLNVPEVLGAQPTLKADLNPAGDICGVIGGGNLANGKKMGRRNLQVSSTALTVLAADGRGPQLMIRGGRAAAWRSSRPRSVRRWRF